MKKLIAMGTLPVLFLYMLVSCDVECELQQFAVYHGEIPDSIINLVPYENGEVVNFLNADGKILTYHVVRESKQLTEQIVEECYVSSTTYAVDETNLVSDSANCPIEFAITNRVEFDFYAVKIKNTDFTIPATEYYYQLAHVVDSMTINNVVYYNVLKETPFYFESQNADSLNADTLFYNYEFGILEIDFENGERFQRVP